MAFYKVNTETQEIEVSEHVSGIGFDLSEESKDEYAYPVEGWIYAESLEAAIGLLNAATA